MAIKRWCVHPVACTLGSLFSNAPHVKLQAVVLELAARLNSEVAGLCQSRADSELRVSQRSTSVGSRLLWSGSFSWRGRAGDSHILCLGLCTCISVRCSSSSCWQSDARAPLLFRFLGDLDTP